MDDYLNDFFSDYNANNNSKNDGLSPVRLGLLLKNIYPNISEWFIWDVSYKSYNSHLRTIIDHNKKEGKTKNFSWKYIEDQRKYPNNIFKGHSSKEKNERGDFWLGFVRVNCVEANKQFLLFSYLSSQGHIGNMYCSSTNDYNLLEEFGKELEEATDTSDKVKVSIFESYSLQPFYIKKENEQMIMNQDIKNDIENQALMFFKTRDLYNKMGLIYKRGFLFIGHPGNGKTLMIRNLFRKIHNEYKGNVSFFLASIARGLDTDGLEEIFRKANEETPSVLVFEDIESLTKESSITRSEFLNKLDGIKAEDGVLIIGTTNNPGDVDNALIQRPSRFDRVWYFKLPEEKLRLEYLKSNFPQIKEKNLIKISKETNDWNFSYLNELRISSALLSIGEHLNENISDETVLNAFELLKKQFELCKNKEKILENGECKKSLGFNSIN